MTRVALFAAALFLAGCAAAPQRAPLPAALLAEAGPGADQNVRAWGDVTTPEERARVRAIYSGIVRQKRARSGDPVKLDFLALSGGGPAGAFSAGLLAGWTETGGRPAFDIVSGISVGALIAPFAFAGPDYDPTLKRFFTETATTAAPVVDVFGLLGGALGLLDTAPLRAALETFVDETLLARVAAEHDAGRRLLVGTTNLDAGRPVIWNMGLIAKSGDIGLFRDVMLASASIPGAFPPVAIRVEAGGAVYDEFHVDGGVTHAVIVWPEGYERALVPDPSIPTETTIYVIQNNSLLRPYQPVEPRVGPIASRALSTMILVQSGEDLKAIAAAAEVVGGDFRLAFIPAELDITSTTDFDVGQMTRLYDAAFADARDGIDWMDRPPAP